MSSRTDQAQLSKAEVDEAVAAAFGRKAHTATADRSAADIDDFRKVGLSVSGAEEAARRLQRHRTPGSVSAFAEVAHQVSVFSTDSHVDEQMLDSVADRRRAGVRVDGGGA